MRLTSLSWAEPEVDKGEGEEREEEEDEEGEEEEEKGGVCEGEASCYGLSVRCSGLPTLTAGWTILSSP